MSTGIGGVSLVEYAPGGHLAPDGEELGPLIVVGALSGSGGSLLSEIHSDLWARIVDSLRRRLEALEAKRLVTLSPTGRKVATVFFTSRTPETSIVYFAHTRHGKVRLEFDRARLAEAEAEIADLARGAKLGPLHLGIDLETIDTDGYLWPFDELPPSADREKHCLLADLDRSTRRRIKFQTHLHVAVAFEQMGRHRSAIKHAEIAARIAPDELVPHILLVRAYEKVGDAARSDAELERAEAIDRSEPHLRFLMAGLYASRRDQERAIRELEHAAERGFSPCESVVADPFLSAFLDDQRMADILDRMRANGSRRNPAPIS